MAQHADRSERSALPGCLLLVLSPLLGAALILLSVWLRSRLSSADPPPHAVFVGPASLVAPVAGGATFRRAPAVALATAVAVFLGEWLVLVTVVLAALGSAGGA